MLVLPSIGVRRNDGKNAYRAWNDPERALYPYHAEFWPERLPEHVLLERRLQVRRRRLRKLLLRRLLRRVLGSFPPFRDQKKCARSQDGDTPTEVIPGKRSATGGLIVPRESAKGAEAADRPRLTPIQAGDEDWIPARGRG